MNPLYEYNRWANPRVLDAASRLTAEAFSRDLGSSFPSVRETLAHILGGGMDPAVPLAGDLTAGAS